MKLVLVTRISADIVDDDSQTLLVAASTIAIMDVSARDRFFEITAITKCLAVRDRSWWLSRAIEPTG